MGRLRYTLLGLFIPLFVAADPPQMDYRPKGVAPIQQWLKDPSDPNQAWALSKESLQFNRGLRSKQQWAVKFTPRTYSALTKKDGKAVLLKLAASTKKRGTVYLRVQDPRGGTDMFATHDFGETWKFLEGHSDFSRVEETATIPPPVAVAPVPSPTPEPTATAPTPTVEAIAATPPSTLPSYKFYFDMLLNYRSAANPLTFDNYHTVALIDFMPRPEIKFSFELATSPRYYQLDYAFTEKFGIFLGRIIVPFDDMDPHNMFGGYWNNSRNRPAGTPAFLPDIWSDLGIGMKYKLLSSGALSVLAHLYVVNGFQANGTVPTGAPATEYPEFGGMMVPNPDNNTDKAIGIRLEAEFFRRLVLAVSAYESAWTKEADPLKRLLILGFYARFRPNSSTQLKLGYAFFTIQLPDGSAPETFQRGGVYGEVRQKFGGGFYGAIDAGLLQTDDRVVDPGDQIIVGGRFGYMTAMLDANFQYRYDLKESPGKTSRTYAGFRVGITL